MELTPERITIVAAVLGALGAGYKKMWVWGYQLLDEKAAHAADEAAYEARIKVAEERARRWEDIALRALKLGERTVEKVQDV